MTKTALLILTVIITSVWFIQDIECSLSHILSDRNSLGEEAYENHRLGIEAAHKGDYSLSLAYLRRAVRLKPNDSYLLNDLGVTEMRTGQYKTALKRFVRAIDLDGYEVARENIEELRRFLPNEEIRRFTRRPYPQLHEILKLKELSVYTLSRYTINKRKRFLEASKSILSTPFVVRRALQSLNWTLDVDFIGALLDKFGNFTAEFYPHNLQREDARPFLARFDDALRQLFTVPDGIYADTRWPVDISEAKTYLHLNVPPAQWEEILEILGEGNKLPDLLDDWFWVRHCFSSGAGVADFHIKTHWKMLMIGEAGSGMFNHKDTLRTASFQLQIAGRKKWHLCGPSEDAHVYNAGDVDAFNPDYDSYPLFMDAKCYQVTLGAGDIIFYPKDYWHQTLNMETPTIALTGTLITPDNYNATAEEMRKECEDMEMRIFSPTESLCDDLERCSVLWRGYFEDGNDLADLHEAAKYDRQDCYLKHHVSTVGAEGGGSTALNGPSDYSSSPFCER